MSSKWPFEPATVTVVNDGPDATEGVRVALALSPGVAVISSVVPSNTQFNGTAWTVNRLARGERRTLRLGLRSVTPTDGATVTADVIGEAKGKKLRVVKYKRRKGYHIEKGHRQKYLAVKVTGINV